MEYLKHCDKFTLQFLHQSSRSRGILIYGRDVNTKQLMLLNELQVALADLGGARPARAPPFAWHPSF